ncbi:cell division protein FtsL [Pararoseomonas indoligenes]|uniref:Cell division protein FtsL n=1 Tax=Roseomonas indoligenes TaxID=2820811 RepID=A0A940MWU3_9PROT|nr:hypothetical protein [Pararoseomonas indoligenes]MBP0493536.1 hypothetical protein [Pararoseomonas indoligenes]
MIRPLTFLSLVAAAGAGLHLYSVKHDVSQLEKVLRDTVKQTEAARERTAVLRAEWAMLNEPERLRAAANRVLPLEVMQTAQFVRPAELDRRLPAAVSFAGAPSLFAPIPGERGGSASSVAVAAAASVTGIPGPSLPATAGAADPNLFAALPLPPDAPPPPPAAPARPAPVAVASAERAPSPPAQIERAVVERPARVAPPHLPQVATMRLPEPREPAPRPAEIARSDAGRAEMARAEAPRAPRPRVAEPRLAEREVDRGMNLAAPPQPAALLRTALHMRPSAPPPPAPVSPSPLAAQMGSMLGAASRPMLAPPVPVASASAGTLR